MRFLLTDSPMCPFKKIFVLTKRTGSMKGATRPRLPAQSYLPHSTCPSRLPRARWCRGTTVVALFWTLRAAET